MKKSGPYFFLEGLKVSFTSKYITKCTGPFPSSASETFSCVIHFTAINIPYSYNPSELVYTSFLSFISLEKCRWNSHALLGGLEFCNIFKTSSLYCVVGLKLA